MATAPPQDVHDPSVLLHKLCTHITGLSGDAVAPYFEYVLKLLGSHSIIPVHDDEFYFSEKIKKKLIREKREKDVTIFADHHRKLQKSIVLKNRSAILCFLLNLQNEGKSQKSKPSLFARGLSALVTSTPFSFSKEGNSYKQKDKSSSLFMSSISTIHSSGLEPTPLPSSYISSSQSVPQESQSYKINNKFASTSKIPSLQIERKANSEVDNKEKNNVTNFRKLNDSTKSTGSEVSEALLIRELIYIFQGIEGKILKLDVGKDGFRIDPKVNISKPMATSVLRLAELGWLHNKIKKYHDSRLADKGLGPIGQSFVAALNQELTEYYRLLAVLESQLQQEDDPNLNGEKCNLTLRRLQLWTFEPIYRLRMLAALVDICKGLRGGALASAVHSYWQHGDPEVRGLVRNILAKMAVPIYTMLARWIFDGELEDNFHEFFVAADTSVVDDKLWHEKYSIRKSMVPSFISMSQAKKILSTGKAINFLRQVCQDSSPLKTLDSIRGSLESTSLESLFTQDGDLQNMIDTAYKETSRRVLDIMQTKYKFMEHLKAMRRYLLLGQGDFIRHLMDILESDLSKPASLLYRHNLSGSLESAIRATNAQFDDPDILKRLDVRLFEVSSGDFGWDVFSLDYHVDGPIGTVFTPSVMMTYLRLFNALWRAKRMEYVLSNVWKSQMTHSRMLKSFPDLTQVLHQCYMLVSEMVHFVQQIQYYITFEVMECSWDVLEKKVKSAEDLDMIIAAHEEFLETIMARALLDDESKELFTKLRAVYDLIIQLQSIQDRLCQRAIQEVKRLKEAEEKIQQNTEQGKWGEDQATTEANNQHYQDFIKTVVPTTRAQLRLLSQSYQDMVQQFLLMLTSHPDVSLQFLSFRLDFNEHYKNRDFRLSTHLTYQHRRHSSLGLSQAAK